MEEFAYYRLVNGEPTPCSFSEFAAFFENSERIIKQDRVGEVLVSTVFLCIPHGMENGQPILFETMIFGGEYDGYQQRYYTMAAAMIGHLQAFHLAKGSTKPEEPSQTSFLND